MITDIIKHFGSCVIASEIKQKPNLAFYLSNRKMYQIEVDDAVFVLIKINPDEKFGTTALKKQLAAYTEYFQCNAAFEFESVTKAQRDALMKHRIPFITLSEQAYLPFLGVILNDNFKKQKHVNVRKMMPATQQLFLYLLYQKDSPVLKSEAADTLGLTRTSITRASEQLDSMGLIEQIKNGKEIHMSLKYDPRRTLELAKSYLINPVQIKLHIKKNDLPKQWLYAGETALSEYSMLNAPKVTDIAVFKNSIDRQTLKGVDIRWEDADSVVNVELWKYNPALFSTSDKVDPVSLACSFMDCGDERVEMAIDEMLEVTQW